MDAAVLALRDAGWKPRILNRRLRLFDLRCARGIPMVECAKALGISERSAYYDWVEIRAVLGAASAPLLEETRCRGEARLERIYTLLMAEVGRTSQAGGMGFVRALREARNTVVDSMELRGAIDRRALAVLQAPPDDSRDLMRRDDEELRKIATREARFLEEILVGANGKGEKGLPDG